MAFVYAVKTEDRYGDGSASDGMRYRCLLANNKEEVRRYLSGYRIVSIVRVNIDDGFLHLVQLAGQEVRKLVYEGAQCEKDLDRIAPGWRKRNEMEPF